MLPHLYTHRRTHHVSIDGNFTRSAGNFPTALITFFSSSLDVSILFQSQSQHLFDCFALSINCQQGKCFCVCAKPYNLSIIFICSSMRNFLGVLCFCSILYDALALSSNEVTLLSLLRHWTFVPPSINSSWNASNSTPCSWVGIHCDHAHNVISLNLTDYGISGHLGPEIGQLNHLQTIVLLKNMFYGEIPSELGNCSLLEYLDLSKNRFFGKIPAELGKCKSLRKLQLYSNQLEGEIPNELGMLNELEHLELSFNHLTGQIAVSIWKIRSLEYILVQENSLFGELPLEMTELKHLKNISLFHNQFSGIIPQTLGINSSLVKLDFTNNLFSGNIPPNLCFGKKLHTLILSQNQLQGNIPSDIGRCETLVWLFLSRNNLTGSLPHFERNLPLIYMDISKNNLSGTIPSSLGNCRNLTEINLSMNKLTGLIPSELGNLRNLWVLKLADNNLEGPLPRQLSSCNQMDHFDVGFNFLNGSFPSILKSWKRLTKLILSENNFTGIPDFLSEFDQLNELQLGGNLFGGRIPESIGALRNLLYGLNISANELNGEIPKELMKLQMLKSLDVSHNNLVGSIQYLDLDTLVEVNFSYNSFDGPIPGRLMRFLSSPSSFLGNSGLCIDCSYLAESNCINSFKPCNESGDHKNESGDHKLSHRRGTSKRLIAMITAGFGFGFGLGFGLTVLVYRWGLAICTRPKQEFSPTVISQKHHQNKCKFLHPLSGVSENYVLNEATEKLNEQYIIGRGAQGTVYKFSLNLLPNHTFAVKKIDISGNKKKRLNMDRELQTIGKIMHRNLIKFYGFFVGKDYGLIFYPYMENGSLHDVLHAKNLLPSLAWDVRYKIAIGIAQGLKYLHHDCYPPIVHRDIKPKNILLDSDMEPCISDFGLAMVLNQSFTGTDTESTPTLMRVSNVVGTIGYIAPESAYTPVQNGKPDVYSYGVVLLELITRKKVLDSSFMEETTLVAWVRSVWKETGDIERIVDQSLTRELSNVNILSQVLAVFLLALRCTEKNSSRRPTMRDVVEKLLAS